MKMDISMLSSRYRVRVLDDADADRILSLYRENPQFYRYCEAEPTREQVLRDMHITPPGVGLSDKYFLGFFEGDDLAAVMDLVDGYPDPGTAYIGLFMMDKKDQGKQIGTAIISETAAYLKAAGKKAIRLAIDKGNPQSTHFWRKNGFRVISEADVNGWTRLVAERPLE